MYVCVREEGVMSELGVMQQTLYLFMLTGKFTHTHTSTHPHMRT